MTFLRGTAFCMYDESLLEAGLSGVSPFDVDSAFRTELEVIHRRIVGAFSEGEVRKKR